MRKITRLENDKMKKILTHELVKEVTRSMNEANFMGFEARIKAMILKLIEPSIKNLKLNEDLITKYAESTRKNVRRIHEIEYAI